MFVRRKGIQGNELGLGWFDIRSPKFAIREGTINLISRSNWSAAFLFARIIFLLAAGLLANLAFADQTRSEPAC